MSITPPLGPMLTQHGIDVRSFCNMFNNETKNFDKGFLVKVILNVYTNNTFTYIIKSSPLFFLFELASEVFDIERNYLNYRGISLYDLYLITLIKNWEYNFINLEILFKFIVKEAKKNRYKIIEKKNDDFYYLYI